MWNGNQNLTQYYELWCIHGVTIKIHHPVKHHQIFWKIGKVLKVSTDKNRVASVCRNFTFCEMFLLVQTADILLFYMITGFFKMVNFIASFGNWQSDR